MTNILQEPRLSIIRMHLPFFASTRKLSNRFQFAGYQSLQIIDRAATIYLICGYPEFKFLTLFQEDSRKSLLRQSVLLDEFIAMLEFKPDFQRFQELLPFGPDRKVAVGDRTKIARIALRRKDLVCYVGKGVEHPAVGVIDKKHAVSHLICPLSLL